MGCIQDSYQAYLGSGARSPEKLRPAHQWIADALLARLSGGDYEAFGMRVDNSDAHEIAAAGLYYDKKIDIAVKHKGRVVSGVGFKFVASNYKQNSNNFFEGMLGETANLRRGGVGYGVLMALPSKVRYLKRDGSVSGHEVINDKNMEKYLRLWCDSDRDFPHKPEVVGLVFVDIDYAKRRVARLTNIDKTEFSDEIKDYLKTGASLENFFNVFVKLTEYKAAACR